MEATLLSQWTPATPAGIMVFCVWLKQLANQAPYYELRLLGGGGGGGGLSPVLGGLTFRSPFGLGGMGWCR